MITLHDLEEAILECQGERNPDAKTCQKLAAFYIIKERMYPESEQQSNDSVPSGIIRSGGGNISIGNAYSNDEGRRVEDYGYQSDTEFARIAENIDKNALMRIMDELMSVLEATNARLYNGVIRKMLNAQD